MCTILGRVWHKKDDKILACLILGVLVVKVGDTLQIDKIGMITYPFFIKMRSM